MDCPVCKTTSLRSQELEEGLRTLKCEQCDGHWVQAYLYWKWLDRHGETLPEKPAEEVIPVADTEEAKICPECERILIRRKVGHDLDFYLDRCAHCGGIWFDKNEWEALKSRNLHDEVHFIFSSAWQHDVAEEERAESHEEFLIAQIGEERLAELRELKAWIVQHPHASTILAFLNYPQA